MSRNITAANACLVLLLGGASLSPANAQSYRRPLGVYAHVDIDSAITYASKNIPHYNSMTMAEQHIALQGLYEGLLSDTAISGIAAGAHWGQIQLSSPLCTVERNCAPFTENGYLWDYVDDVFIAANAKNKSVQLIVIPGVDTPGWVLQQIQSCDGMFISATDATGYAPADCGTVVFKGYPEESHGDTHILPLPWNTTYINAWAYFLGILNGRYYSNTAFVAITVAGPTCASTEMILPTTANGSIQKKSGMPADQAWAALIAHSFPGVNNYQASDQVFIDYWKQAIDLYEQTFRGITLIVSPDSGDDLSEIEALLARLDNIQPSRVLLMPEGTDSETLHRRARMLVRPVMDRNWRLTQRLHIDLFGNTKGT